MLAWFANLDSSARWSFLTTRMRDVGIVTRADATRDPGPAMDVETNKLLDDVQVVDGALSLAAAIAASGSRRRNFVYSVGRRSIDTPLRPSSTPWAT